MHCQGRFWRDRHGGEPPNARWKTLVTDFALADDSFCWISYTMSHPSGLPHLRRMISAELMPVLCWLIREMIILLTCSRSADCRVGTCLLSRSR